MLVMALSAGVQRRSGATCRMLANRPVAHLAHYLFLEACESRSLSNADRSRPANYFIRTRYKQWGWILIALVFCTGVVGGLVSAFHREPQSLSASTRQIAQ